ncbi:2-amino-4-hydroxy-6-hydroxymethyldihydropteridinepyrophosphokinase [hydrothermal vent metagenome]|uniref:2-amino-4-hydroxy-6-hydroxymethyldihydropteridine diphosphokinase n=1 Tax=hydrothermal vent metagenome TaxID=652676 RepID=A0A1W1CMW6_9ZZZZ
MPIIHINLGSNVDKTYNINQAINLISKSFNILEKSAIYQSPAEGFEGADFYNIGINAQTDLSIIETNKILRKIEKKLGRNRNIPKFSDRKIDLDLVLYDNIIDKNLNIPRNDILKYAFVLAPLVELNPKQKHPVEGITYQQLWDKFTTKENLKRL